MKFAKNFLVPLFFVGLTPLTSQASQVCVGQSGSFAGTTVTIACNSNTQQSANQLLMGPSSPSSCTFTFASPITPSDFVFKILGMNGGETAEFAFNGGSTYALSNSELPTGYALSGSGITSSGGTAAPSSDLSFSNAPASISSITANGTGYYGLTPCYQSTPTYTIGGSVSGLASGQSLTLQNNGGDNATVVANGNFAFSTAINSGSAYAVTVGTQPTGQTCNVSAGSGTATANVTNVSVTCTTNEPAPIPTLSEWAMIFLASLMAMFGIRRMRRNK